VVSKSFVSKGYVVTHKTFSLISCSSASTRGSMRFPLACRDARTSCASSQRSLLANHRGLLGMKEMQESITIAGIICSAHGIRNEAFPSRKEVPYERKYIMSVPSICRRVSNVLDSFVMGPKDQSSLRHQTAL
jgi:hypothetical protein